jgi:hypothetical protein
MAVEHLQMEPMWSCNLLYMTEAEAIVGLQWFEMAE